MKDQFVPSELSLKLKEKKFNEPCLAYHSASTLGQVKNDGKELEFRLWYFNDNAPKTNSEIAKLKQFTDGWISVCAPLYQQVQEWAIAKNYYFEVSSFPIYNGKYGYRFGRGQGTSGGFTPNLDGETRRDAFNKAIDELLKIMA